MNRNKIMKDRNYFGCMMVETGEADAMISGLTKNYPDTIRPAMQIIGMEDRCKKIAGMYLLLTKRGPLFLGRYHCELQSNCRRTGRYHLDGCQGSAATSILFHGLRC